MSDVARVSISLTDQTVEKLDDYADYLGVSRSALLSVLIDRELDILDGVTGDNSCQRVTAIFDVDRRRMRGKSAEIIRGEIEHLIERGI